MSTIVGRVNINDHVWVRLTERGRDIARAHHQALLVVAPRLGPYCSYETNGWSRWQLWQLMQRFGADCHLGCDPPFETEISLVDPNDGSNG